MDAKDAQGVRDAATRLEAIARVMIAYLTDHPPAPCYASFQTSYANGLAALERAAANYAVGANEAGNADAKFGLAQREAALAGVHSAEDACRWPRS